MSVQYSAIREIFDMAPKGSINMGIGEPDFDPPLSAIEGLKSAAEMRLDKYGPTMGSLQLRAAIAKMHLDINDQISEDNVMITVGGTQAIMAAFQTMIDPASEVLIPDPGFVLYSPDSFLIDAEPVPYHLIEEEGFDPDIEEIKGLIGPRTEAIVMNSPSNPTGGVIKESVVRAIADLAHDHSIKIISDEVYTYFVYECQHNSFLPYLDRAIVVNSFSKCLGVTGWRIGYLVADEGLMNQLSKFNYYDIACPATPIQYAVLQALPDIPEFMRFHRQEYDARRKAIIDGLNDIPGFHCVTPKGAFYAFPAYRQDISSLELARRLVHAGVICVPGSVFGDYGEHHLRISYANSMDNIHNGLEIIENTVRNISYRNR
jgi:aspartate aminotransferase